MSKAIEGGALLAGALGMGVAAFFDPALVVVPGYLHIMEALVMGGISLEASAIASSIGSEKGIGITTRQAAGLRQIVYGTRRVGGTSVYESTTGTGGSSGNYVYNWVIALASHEIDGVQKLFLDGREVYWKQTANPNGYRANMGQGSVSTPPTISVTISFGGAITAITATGGSGFANVKPVDGYRVIIRGNGTGAQAYATNSGTVGSPVWTVHIVSGGAGYTTATAEIQGAFTFGGTGAADEQDPSQSGYGLGYGIGPGGPHYNFSGKVYAEVRWGDQPAGDIMASLQANDSAWTPPGGKNLSGQGVAYLYLNVGYDATLFPQAPEIRLTINGKNKIFDPRTATIGFSTNWALQVADVLTDPVYGVGDVVNQAQLIAAANVCDQLVATSQGNEANFAQHLVYNTGTSPGEALAMMMPNAAGRITRIGGEWFIWPAYWQSSSFTWDKSALLDKPNWDSTRSFKDLVNRVNGTFIAPNYPYNVAGNLYDKNGWYYGVIANNWPFAWQPTNFPQYAQDVLHGYSTDAFLAADGGIQLPLELELKGCISIVQAQRIAKIYLLRNRQQGSGTFHMQLAAMAMQPTDVMEFNFPEMGWTNKVLEVGQFQFALEPVKQPGGEEVMALTVIVPVQETDISVYSWASGEELTPYSVPALPGNVSVVQPPTGLTLTDNATTAIMQSDGTVMPRLMVSWTAPNDAYVTANGSIQLQWRDHAGTFQSGNWIDTPPLSGDAAYAFIDSISSVASVDVQIRAVRPNGAASVWVQALGHTIVRGSPIPGPPLRINGVTANPAVASSFADLPELGSADSAMTVNLASGRSCLLGISLGFSSISAGGAVNSLGVTFADTTGFAPPNVTLSISGDGSGASASLSWANTSGSGPTAVWHPTLTLNGGANYTMASVTITTVITSSNGDTGYTAGTTSNSCTVSTPTVNAGVPVSIQVLMDGSVVLGPITVYTSASGTVQFSAYPLIPTPSAGNHSFQVQASTSSGTAIASTGRTFQLVPLF